MTRDWSLANVKRAAEQDRCRICGTTPSEMAHLTSRQYDDVIGRGILQVGPASVIPLCKDHHLQYDLHELDILAYINRDEEIDAVARVGIERAYRRLAPSLFATEASPEAIL